jgi:hypothetical protein
MQDPNPLPWGAQDRFQAHFIVRKKVDDVLSYSARVTQSTTGYFGSKKITDIKWNGGKIADALNSDSSLKELLIQQSPDDAAISIEPTGNGVRIYGKWKNSFEFGVTKDQFEIYDKIAGHIKNL